MDNQAVAPIVLDLESQREVDLETGLPIEGRQSVDHLLRTSQVNLMNISSMADQKANIVLGASLIMITIIVGLLSQNDFTASLAILGAFTVVSSVSALLAVMPSTGKNPTGDQNPLYFGNAAYLTPEDHRTAMAEVLVDDASVYKAILTDIHEASVLLQHRKFRYLRISYAVFIVGLLATAVAVMLEWVA